jgi:hypothetical protein
MKSEILAEVTGGIIYLLAISGWVYFGLALGVG